MGPTCSDFIGDWTFVERERGGGGERAGSTAGTGFLSFSSALIRNPGEEKFRAAEFGQV